METTVGTGMAELGPQMETGVGIGIAEPGSQMGTQSQMGMAMGAGMAEPGPQMGAVMGTAVGRPRVGALPLGPLLCWSHGRADRGFRAVNPNNPLIPGTKIGKISGSVGKARGQS